jgi:hypothetical protein
VDWSCLDEVDSCNSIGEDWEGYETGIAEATGYYHIDCTLEAGAKYNPCCEGEIVRENLLAGR